MKKCVMIVIVSVLLAFAMEASAQPKPMQPTSVMTSAPMVASMEASKPAMVASNKTAKAEIKLVEKTEVKNKMSVNAIADLVFKILGGIVSLIFSILGGVGYLKWVRGERWKKIQKYVDLAFPAVEALVEKTNNKIDDKLVEFLKQVNGLLKKHGESELTNGEKAAVSEVASNKALAEKLNG